MTALQRVIALLNRNKITASELNFSQDQTDNSGVITAKLLGETNSVSRVVGQLGKSIEVLSINMEKI